MVKGKNLAPVEGLVGFLVCLNQGGVSLDSKRCMNVLSSVKVYGSLVLDGFLEEF